MARVTLSEYRAKRLLFGDQYQGINTAGESVKLSANRRYVVKVDQGIKKRFKLGLIALNVGASEIATHIRSFKKKGFTAFLIEPYVSHKKMDERYISFERVRNGVRVLYSTKGGVDIEDNTGSVQVFEIRDESNLKSLANLTNIPHEFLKNVYEKFNALYFSFLEINPLVVSGHHVYALDAALLVDSAAEQLVSSQWSGSDIAERKKRHAKEQIISELAKTTPASLKLSVFNPDGSLFFLLSGGGGSITIADHAALAGAGLRIANYGEYSGGPSTEETYLYAREIIDLALSSRSKKKALVIAGGIANFTDVKSTFTGIIQALDERKDELKRKGVKVFVRRGGPHEAEGLSLMRDFLTSRKILGSISGSDAPITDAVHNAVHYLES